jgi:hypothetical protein
MRHTHQVHICSIRLTHRLHTLDLFKNAKTLDRDVIHQDPLGLAYARLLAGVLASLRRWLGGWIDIARLLLTCTDT